MSPQLPKPARLKAWCCTGELTGCRGGSRTCGSDPASLTWRGQTPLGFSLAIPDGVFAFYIHQLLTQQAARSGIARTIAQSQWCEHALSHLCTAATVHCRNDALAYCSPLCRTGEIAPATCRSSAGPEPWETHLRSSRYCIFACVHRCTSASSHRRVCSILHSRDLQHRRAGGSIPTRAKT